LKGYEGSGQNLPRHKFWKALTPSFGLSELKFGGLRTVERSENTVTPRGMVLLGKLIVPQLAKIFIAMYEFPRFIIVPITARHLSLS
jgi:hypothetical protein